MIGHIRKRGKNSWAIKITLGRDPLTNKRKDKWITIRGTKRDAEAKRAELVNSINNGSFVEPTRLTVAEYLGQWLTNDAEHTVSAKTFERYKEIVEKHLSPAIGMHKLHKLSPAHIQSYYGEALKFGRRDGNGGLSARTVIQHHRVLSRALKQAVRLQILFRNPCELVDPPRAERREMNVLQKNDIETLLKYFNDKTLHMTVLLAVTTGMRLGEILALRWKNVDLEHDSLSVTQTLEQTQKGLNFKPPKTSMSRRTISLPKMTILALKKHKAAQAKERLRLGPAWNDHGLVCPRYDGQPRAPKSVSSEFKKISVKAGFSSIRFHDLRHSHISLMLAEGVHPKVASERAGHASVSITLDVYSHVIPGLQEDAARKIDAALGTSNEH